MFVCSASFWSFYCTAFSGHPCGAIPFVGHAGVYVVLVAPTPPAPVRGHGYYQNPTCVVISCSFVMFHSSGLRPYNGTQPGVGDLHIGRSIESKMHCSPEIILHRIWTGTQVCMCGYFVASLCDPLRLSSGMPVPIEPRLIPDLAQTPFPLAPAMCGEPYA